jgi:hypothetical protein
VIPTWVTLSPVPVLFVLIGKPLVRIYGKFFRNELPAFTIPPLFGSLLVSEDRTAGRTEKLSRVNGVFIIHVVHNLSTTGSNQSIVSTPLYANGKQAVERTSLAKRPWFAIGLPECYKKRMVFVEKLRILS